MKQAYWLFLIAVPLLFSCKKTYSCVCNTTVTVYDSKSARYYTEVVPGNNAAYDQKLTEKQAKAACTHEEVATQTNFTNLVTYNGRFPLSPGESVNTSCGLK